MLRLESAEGTPCRLSHNLSETFQGSATNLFGKHLRVYTPRVPQPMGKTQPLQLQPTQENNEVLLGRCTMDQQLDPQPISEITATTAPRPLPELRRRPHRSLFSDLRLLDMSAMDVSSTQGATVIRLATDRSITARNCLHKALAHPGRALAADTHAHKALAHPGRALAAGMSMTTKNK